MRLSETVFNIIAPYDCLGCQSEGKLVCSECWPQLVVGGVEAVNVPGLDACWAVTDYDGLARSLVRSMKIDCCRQAGYLMARAMSESLPRLSGILVTSVPTASARIRERGFDHARLIAEEFARLSSLGYQSLLIRHGRAKQAGASKIQRTEQIRRVYQVSPKFNLSGKEVLVIDDVMTTGATLTEVASILRVAGVRRVQGLVFAGSPQTRK